MFVKYKQAGETIIEVLIAITVLSATLGAAFAIAGKSQKTVQANQERYQAQLYANQQADLMKLGNAENLISGAYLLSSNYFCMYTETDISTGLPKVKISSLTDRTSLVAECKKTSDSGLVYEIAVTHAVGSNAKFVITVEWDSLINKGTAKDIVRLVYGIK